MWVLHEILVNAELVGSDYFQQKKKEEKKPKRKKKKEMELAPINLILCIVTIRYIY